MSRNLKKTSKDVNEIAVSVIEQITGSSSQNTPAKNPAAVALGRLGGLKGGKARAAKLSKKRRQEIAKKAAASRWKKT